VLSSYDDILRGIEPKRKRIPEMQAVLKLAQNSHQAKESELDELVGKIDLLKTELRRALDENRSLAEALGAGQGDGAPEAPHPSRPRWARWAASRRRR